VGVKHRALAVVLIRGPLISGAVSVELFKRRLGKKIRRLRLSAKKTQEDVEEFSVNVKQYQRIERGLVDPRASTILKLCRAFKCKPNDMLT
jgi:DNA-binding XRE family transcriptional regulator